MAEGTTCTLIVITTDKNQADTQRYVIMGIVKTFITTGIPHLALLIGSRKTEH
jgi:hypothetical protein